MICIGEKASSMSGLRIFNSTTPFGKGSPTIDYQLELNYGSKDNEYQEYFYPKEMPQKLKVLLTQGSAKQVGAQEQDAEKLSTISIIAQAESEGSQEFSPTSTEHSYIRSHLLELSKERTLAIYGSIYSNMDSSSSYGKDFFCPTSQLSHRLQRKRHKRQRHRKRKGEEELLEQTLLKQDSSNDLLQDQYSSSIQSLSVQETEKPGSVNEFPIADFQLDKTCSWTQPGFADLLGLSQYSEESSLDSPECSMGKYDIAINALRYSVSQVEPCFLVQFFRKVEKEAAEEECEGNGPDINEGILFQPEELLKPQNFEFREGKEFSLVSHIQSGSFGDVYSIKDNATGFKCAAKKVPLKKFNSEELGSWSALDSPRIVELYGAVRDGPNIFVFMDLKSGSLGQLLRDRGRLPQDLSLHYQSQVLGALEHLHKRGVLHRDIKDMSNAVFDGTFCAVIAKRRSGGISHHVTSADNVLLSEDGKDSFLCDFGHSEKIGPHGQSSKAFRGKFQGTVTHMAPEVVKGDPTCTKADIWSICCMLLHMLNGFHPWTRYYNPPLCLKIAHEPPPLREIPPDCNPNTIKAFHAGLQKDPADRASATELKDMVIKALKEVGGLTSPVKGEYQPPLDLDLWEKTCKSCRPMPSLHDLSSTDSSLDKPPEQDLHWVSPWMEVALEEDQYKASECGDAEVKETDHNDMPWESLSSEISHHVQVCESQVEETPTLSEQELQKLSIGLILSQLHPPELQEQLLSQLRSDCSSMWEPGEKDTVNTSDDLSSGFCSSYISETDRQSFNIEWLSHIQQPVQRCFEGVDVWIEGFNSQCLCIRESPKVKVGHVAAGISDQISQRAFTLETMDGKVVPCDQPIPDSGIWLRCIPALDSNCSWKWRIYDGELERRN